MSDLTSTLARRRLIKRAITMASMTAVTGTALRNVLAQSDTPARVIEVTAKRFEFIPKEISVKLGEKIVLAISSLDFIHGMNIPDLAMRADLMPGRVTRIELVAKKLGNIDFVCDNFCGEHHEDMHCRLIVTA